MTVSANTAKEARSNRLQALARRARGTRGARGAVLVEYAFLLIAVAIPVMMGISAGGMQMLSQYRSARTSLMAPIP